MEGSIFGVWIAHGEGNFSSSILIIYFTYKNLLKKLIFIFRNIFSSLYLISYLIQISCHIFIPILIPKHLMMKSLLEPIESINIL